MNMRIADAVNNSAGYIAQLCAMEDQALQRKLRIVREQMQLAFQQSKSDSFELLQLWEEQIITARYIRNEENKPQTQPRTKNISPQQPITASISTKEIKEEIPIRETAELVSAINQLALF